jgi:DNA-binding HxlR family transcriptional regulator
MQVILEDDFHVKRYDQYCPIACALGLVGERWTLLVVRELMHGPKRYTDLAAELPGIGTNILAARLKELEAAGLVEKHRLPSTSSHPPDASSAPCCTSSRASELG